MRSIVCLFFAVGFALTATADGVERRPGAGKPPLKVRAVRAPGPAAGGPEPHFWIAYDSGSNAGFPVGAPYKVVGNRFNSASGMALVGRINTIQSVTLFPEESGPQSFSVFGAPNAAGTAVLIDYFNAPLMGGQFNVVQLDGMLNPGADFIVAFMGVFAAGGGLVGLDSQSHAGQGFHAVEGRYSRGAMRTITPIPGRNAMVRVQGFFVTPVELIDFRIQ
jgi:hypothetical protein